MATDMSQSGVQQFYVLSPSLSHLLYLSLAGNLHPARVVCNCNYFWFSILTMGNCIFRFGLATFSRTLPKFNFDYMPTTERLACVGKSFAAVCLSKISLLYISFSAQISWPLLYCGRGCEFRNFKLLSCALCAELWQRDIDDATRAPAAARLWIFNFCIVWPQLSCPLSHTASLGLQYCISFVLLCGLGGWGRVCR